MSKTRAVMGLALALTSAGGCGEDDEADCGAYLGTYVGTLSGTSPLNGTLTLIIAASGPSGVADLTGTWNGESGHYGEINRADLACASGAVSYEYGLSLNGPATVVCPPPCGPGSSAGGCYCNGATLGAFAGNFTGSTGAGTWLADTGAAQTISVTGVGTWSVTKQ